MEVKPWSAYAQLKDPKRRTLARDLLVDMKIYRPTPALKVIVAYAQDSLIYHEKRIIEASAKDYAATPLHERINKFGQIYTRDTPLLLHRMLADIIVDAAQYLYDTSSWTTVLFDGLRTVNGAYRLYQNAQPQWRADKLIATPGASAHSRGLAIDSMMFDVDGREVDMGGHFDHTDMNTNHRNYTGSSISTTARHHRRLREIALQRAALQRKTLIAPLREEFWDDRMPEDTRDLWRILESIARCVGADDIVKRFDTQRRENRVAFDLEWQTLDYHSFCQRWELLFAPYHREMKSLLNTESPPETDAHVVYHGAFNPLYDEDVFLSSFV